MDYHFLWLYKDQWELVYYVAFIVLTVIIALIAAKTYLFQTRKISNLLCKCIESKMIDYQSSFCLEIYNHGNAIAKNISVEIQGRDYGIIPFLKPAESYVIGLTTISQTIGARFFEADGLEIKDNIISVELGSSGEIEKYDIDISIILSSRNFSETDTRGSEDIVRSIRELTKALNNKMI